MWEDEVMAGTHGCVCTCTFTVSCESSRAEGDIPNRSHLCIDPVSAFPHLPCRAYGNNCIHCTCEHFSSHLPCRAYVTTVYIEHVSTFLITFSAERIVTTVYIALKLYQI